MPGYHGNSRYIENGKIVPNSGDSQKTVDKWQKSYDKFKAKQVAVSKESKKDKWR